MKKKPTYIVNVHHSRRGPLLYAYSTRELAEGHNEKAARWEEDKEAAMQGFMQAISRKPKDHGEVAKTRRVFSKFRRYQSFPGEIQVLVVDSGAEATTMNEKGEPEQ